MNVSAGAIAGVVAGAIGAAAWAALAYYANVEIGWLAIGIGALVGFATSAGAAIGGSSTSGDAPSGPFLGGIAVLITIASLCAGKYAIVEIGIQQALAQISAEWNASEPMSDELLVSYVADEIGEDTHGEDWFNHYEWPENTEGEQPASEADYPADLWKQAQTKWDAMSPDEQAAYRQSTAEAARAGMEEFTATMANEARQEGFLATFGVMDLLFFGIAVMAAWGIAGSGEGA